MSRYPIARPRRLRRTEALRAMVRETSLSVDRLIYPLFVCPGTGVRRPIGSMPGCFQLPIDQLVEEAKEVRDLGIPGIILFGIPEHKDPEGSEGYDTQGIVARALETAGIATVVMGAAKDIVERCGVPRFLFSDAPLGNAAGPPRDVAAQDATLGLALDLLESAAGPRTTVRNPLRWPGPPG